MVRAPRPRGRRPTNNQSRSSPRLLPEPGKSKAGLFRVLVFVDLLAHVVLLQLEIEELELHLNRDPSAGK
jgi:hypothetical protein